MSTASTARAQAAPPPSSRGQLPVPPPQQQQQQPQPQHTSQGQPHTNPHNYSLRPVNGSNGLNGSSIPPATMQSTPMRPSRAPDSSLHIHTPSSSSLRPNPAAASVTPSPISGPVSSSSTNGSNTNNNTPSTAIVTIDALLAQYATAPSPTHAALEATVAERNTLAAQNAQLWKMIEKVKANASSLAQDTNRLRAERDSYKRRLADTGESTTTASGDSATRRDREKESRRLKSSASAPLGGGRESPMPNGGRINDLRKLSDDGGRRDDSPARRSPLHRHQSTDDTQPQPQPSHDRDRDRRGPTPPVLPLDNLHDAHSPDLRTARPSATRANSHPGPASAGSISSLNGRPLSPPVSNGRPSEDRDRDRDGDRTMSPQFSDPFTNGQTLQMSQAPPLRVQNSTPNAKTSPPTRLDIPAQAPLPHSQIPAAPLQQPQQQQHQPQPQPQSQPHSEKRPSREPQFIQPPQAQPSQALVPAVEAVHVTSMLSALGPQPPRPPMTTAPLGRSGQSQGQGIGLGLGMEVEQPISRALPQHPPTQRQPPQPLQLAQAQSYSQQQQQQLQPQHHVPPQLNLPPQPQAQAQNMSQGLNQGLSAPARPHAASRESRVPLPDEARLYMMSMASPFASPALGQGGFPGGSATPPGTTGSSNSPSLQPQPQPQPSSQSQPQSQGATPSRPLPQQMPPLVLDTTLKGRPTMLDVPESQSQLNTAGGSSDGGFLDMDDSDVDHEREHEKEGESEEGDGGYDNEREDGREDGRDGGDGASMRDDREGSIDSHASASSRPSVVSSGAGSGTGHDGMQNPSRRKSSLSRSHGSGHTQQSQTQQGRPSEESAYLPYLAEQQSPPQQSHQGHPHMPPPAMRQDSSMSVASGSTANESYSQHQYGLQGQRAPEDSAMGGESMYTQSQSTLVHQQQQSTPTGSISGTGAGRAGGGDDQPTNPDDVWPPVNGDGREPNRYRELPLLAADLPHTTVTVVTSSIKPNDRGKDLLSFIIAVEPGSHKAGWRIEKQYTEVMSLDHRVRSVIGKSAIKKIVSLPEGKLWRDHAPARVDQRKAALEAYLASLISLPVKNKDEIIAFLTSDQIKATQKPVYQEGYKEGYLTKRGKNFGGWKTRYFVLQGPTLEYYESRGGAHLGSIAITGAQIGRQQQRAPERGPADDDNDYRHAFLVIEARKGPSASTRHVLCAENDEERDSWVGVLVRYVNGAYNAELGESLPDQQFQQYQAQEQPQAQSQSKSSFEQTSPVQRRPPPRGPSKDDGATQPTLTALVPPTGPGQSQPSPMLSSAMSPSSGPGDGGIPQQQSYDPALPSSLPAGSPLDEVPVGQRSQSELGWYGVQAPDRQPAYVPRDQRQQMQPNSQAIPEEGERPHTPENQTQGSGSGGGAIAAAIASATSAAGATTPAPGQKGDTSASASASKPKISGPLKGGIIPHGFNFGVKDPVPAPAPAPAAPTPNDRREKTKSRSFWGFGKSNAGGAPDKGAPPPMPSVPVFGVSIEDSLSVSQIAGLPAVVFRAIQYLEAKDADQEEGIYRLSGSTAVIKGLKDRFNMEGDVDLLASDEFWDPHAIAGLLKGFLRELPTSILTRDLHLQFLAVIDFPDAPQRIRELSQLISQLPVSNYSLLRALTAHLIRIVQNANVNKMTMRNVGIVFSPTLGIPAGVFSLMLSEFTRVFSVNDAIEEEEQAAEAEASPAPDRPNGVDRRNSQRYSDTAADKLLGLSGRQLNGPSTIPAPEEAEEADSLQDDTEGSDSVADLSALSPRTHVRAPSDEPNGSRARQAAQTRGLSVNTTPSSDLRARRASRMPGQAVVGLPHSPRPGHRSRQEASTTIENPPSSSPER